MGDKSLQPISRSVTGTALVVDDESINRELLRDVLEGAGHSVTEAENGERALAAVAVSPPDVVLLDVMMPGVDGFEVCRRLKADPATAPIPVLLVTALSERSDRITGIEAGADDFISKPVDPEEVALRVRNSIAAKKLYDQVQESYTKLRELEDVRDGLTEVVTKELRRPLGFIRTSLETLAAGLLGDLDDAQSSVVGNAFDACNRAFGLVDELLWVKLLREGVLHLQVEPVDIAELAREAVEAVQRQAEDGTVVASLSVADDLPEVKGDAAVISLILRKAVAQACAGAESQVAVEARSPAGSKHVEVVIQSDAPAVAGAGVESVFGDRFFAFAARELGGSFERMRDGRERRLALPVFGDADSEGALR